MSESKTNQQAPDTAIETLINKASGYAETRLELARLKAIEKTADGASSIYASMVVFLVAFLCIIMLSIGLALVAGNWLGNDYLGFFLIGGIYAIIAILLYAMRRSLLKTPVNNALIKKILN